MRRYYALVLTNDANGGKVQLVRELDGCNVLAEAPLGVDFYRTYKLELTVSGSALAASVDGEAVLHAEDDALPSGGIALLVDEWPNRDPSGYGLSPSKARSESVHLVGAGDVQSHAADIARRGQNRRPPAPCPRPFAAGREE